MRAFFFAGYAFRAGFHEISPAATVFRNRGIVHRKAAVDFAVNFFASLRVVFLGFLLDVQPLPLVWAGYKKS